MALLRVRDPHVGGAYGRCPFLLLTGHPCPGCGGLRAYNDLTHGDVVGALSSNAMAVVLLVLLFGAWVVWVVRRLRGEPGPLPGLTSTTVVAMSVAFVVFGIFRVTPWGAWFLP